MQDTFIDKSGILTLINFQAFILAPTLALFLDLVLYYIDEFSKELSAL